MKWDWTPLNEEQMDIYRNLCPDGEYRVHRCDLELPGISKGLYAKCSQVLLAASGDPRGRLFFMANLHRPDSRDSKGNAIDQMPFGFVFDSRTPLLSGALVQHGNWDGRSSYPPASAWDQLVEGQYRSFADLNIVPPASAGRIDELDGTSQQRAFSILIRQLSGKMEEIQPIEAELGMATTENHDSPH